MPRPPRERGWRHAFAAAATPRQRLLAAPLRHATANDGEHAIRHTPATAYAIYATHYQPAEDYAISCFAWRITPLRLILRRRAHCTAPRHATPTHHH